jgi:hypothetical protein
MMPNEKILENQVLWGFRKFTGIIFHQKSLHLFCLLRFASSEKITFVAFANINNSCYAYLKKHLKEKE